MCQHFDRDFPDDVIPRIATGFAGGVGNSGATCGAVIGGAMGLSLEMDWGVTMEEALGALATVGDFRRRFEEAMGSISCGDLTGADLTTPEGIQRYMESDIPQTVCFPAVATAYRLVVEMLDERRH